MPQSGSAQAFYHKDQVSGQWAGNQYYGAGLYSSPGGKPTTDANAPSDTSCYDNGNVAGRPQRYSTAMNDGNNKTCALSFKM
jgi:hypothetical protein